MTPGCRLLTQPLRSAPTLVLTLVLVLMLIVFPVAVHGAGSKRGNADGAEEQPADSCRSDELRYERDGDVFCYSLTPSLPFADALAFCRSSSGRLATVYSQEHNDMLYRMLNESAFLGAVARRLMMRHPAAEAGPGIIWSWLSGEAPIFTNVLHTETAGFYIQPNGGGFEGCVEMMKHPVLKYDPGNGFWGDTDCRAPKPALCARRVSKSRPVSAHPTREWQLELKRERRAGCAHGFSLTGVQRQGEQFSRSTCLSGLQEAANFTAATRRCQELDPASVIVRPGRLAGRRRWMPSHSGMGTGQLHWAGADRRNWELQWRWQEDGKRVAPSAWAAGEPRDQLGSDCAAYDPARRGMVATNCDSSIGFVCELPPHGCGDGFHVSATGLECLRDDQTNCDGHEEYVRAPEKSPCSARLCPLACPPGHSQIGLKCLFVNDTSSWFAENAAGCLARGMHVMQPSNEAENEFVRRQAQRTGRPVWVVYPERGGFSRWHEYFSYGLPSEPNESASAPGKRGVKLDPSCHTTWFDGEGMDVDCLGEFPIVCDRPITWQDCADAVEMLKAK